MLARSGFGNDTLFAHSSGDQGLADAVIDFVGPRVQQAFIF